MKKISTEQLCRDYYDSQIYGTSVAFEGQLIAQLKHADSSFSLADSGLFVDELVGLNVELFGLTWFQHNYRLVLSKEQNQHKGDDATCAEILFTKNYLLQIGAENAWKAAGAYNDKILQAAVIQETMVDWSAPRDRGHFDKLRLEKPAQKRLFENQIRDMYDKLLTDKECAVRLGNRLLSVEEWADGILVPQKLASAFSIRINYNPNIESILLLERLVVGIHQNASEYIREVHNYGSWESATKASNALLENAINFARKAIKESKNR